MVQLLKKGFAALVAVLVGITAFAQVTTSSLNGKVTDANGAAVPGAAVVAVHTPSGTQYYAVANAEGTYTDELFGNKTIGTVLSITPEFKVTFTPFLLTNDMHLNTILAIAGLKDDKITALFGDVTLSGIITSDNGDLNGVKFPVVQTLLSREVAKVIGLFYENEKLNALLGDRRFDNCHMGQYPFKMWKDDI